MRCSYRSIAFFLVHIICTLESLFDLWVKYAKINFEV